MVHKHFKEYRGHTAIKHAILKDYIGAWAGILSSWTDKIVFIDGFCGPGHYEVDGKVYDGSPIIALQVADHFADKCEMHCVFIDNDEENIEMLEERIDELDFESDYTAECATFEETMNDILEKVPNIAPAFCFIDPFGFKGLPLELIKEFMQRKATEVFINFMYEPISRFLSHEDMHGHMDALFGTDKWLDVLKKGLRKREKERFLRDLYRDQLSKCADYVWPFKLKNPEKDATLYYLFHCTNHVKGVKVMKDVMYRKGTTGTYSYQGKDDSQMSLFSPEPSETELEKYLLKKYSGKQAMFTEIVDSTWDSPFIDKHYRSVLIKLRKEGKIEKIPVTTKTVGRGFNKEDIAVFPKKRRTKIRRRLI